MVSGALQVVVTEGGRGLQGGLDIARLQPVQAFLCMVRPDAGQAIGLQLRTHLQAAIAGDGLLVEQGLLEGFGKSQLELHVMADLMSDDVSPCEVTDH
ncbi:hypothetical protein D3C85_1705760 [compost metagenome]